MRKQLISRGTGALINCVTAWLIKICKVQDTGWSRKTFAGDLIINETLVHHCSKLLELENATLRKMLCCKMYITWIYESLIFDLVLNMGQPVFRNPQLYPPPRRSFLK